ncbi:microcin C transport system substrate-binding protein [Azorhizobium sp. AG788]|uniref:extracellular solute-binding protein n=1 Tax=Azorhizobium sp. AG788 TaxID=2183897 RepID=UPI0010D07AAA|nr:extracellular solute-binding protein [Azorhizobium sp. AG788]TDT96860.1 microcin C transport system substrate-binding protein [Azorhizobium sp. AG788]
MSAGTDRRTLLRLAAAGGAAAFLPGLGAGRALAQTPPPAPASEGGAAAPAVERHGLSSFGELKYPKDFKNFDYVFPGAPKGGTFSQIGPTAAYNQSFQTFNSLNGYILRGDGAQGIALIFDSLMVRASDEPDAVYGLVASSVSISDDGRTYRFRLRPEARFHDGTPLTAEDVAFSLNTLKAQGHPLIRQALREFTGAEAEDKGTVVLSFTAQRPRDVPSYAATLPIFSKAYYGKHKFEETTLDPPLGSGPYKVGRFEVGRFVEYLRVADYWAADLPVNRGRHNFDVLRFEYFRDREVGFEAFKARAYLFREEFTSRAWATQYDFPALKTGRVKREVLPDETPSGAQGWFFNTRRAKFLDPRVREAIALAFDFEWTNKNLMFGQYERTWSFFQNSDLMAKGLPSPAEEKLLAPFRDALPAEVFGEPYVPPVSDGSGQDRALLRRAAALLKDAGYTIQQGRLVDGKGTALTIEFLDDDGAFERHTSRFIANLKLLGIEASFRIVDPAQYQARLKDFDFDMVVRRYSVSLNPGDELRAYFGSEAARLPGSNNLSGISDKVVDALIADAIAAQTRADLVTACRALDRVLRAGRYWVPQWNKASFWIAYWDVFDRPAVKPKYDRGTPDTWWWRKGIADPPPVVEPGPASPQKDG